MPTIHDKACDMIVQYEIKQGRNPNAWLYIVYDMKKKPRLLKMSRDDILKSCGINTYVEIWVTLPKEFRKAIKNIGAEIEL